MNATTIISSLPLSQAQMHTPAMHIPSGEIMTARDSTATYKLVPSATLDQIRGLASRMLPVPTKLQDPAARNARNARNATQATAIADLSFKFCTWNVLAQMLIKRELYPTSSKQSLTGKYRRELHRAWIEALDADVLCLQEADMDPPHWGSLLRECGYEMTAASFKQGRHGVMVVWKADTWSLRRREQVMLDQHPTGPSSELGKPNGEPTVHGATKNVGLVAELEHLPTGKVIVCATTHLYWIPRGTYVRLRQHAVLMSAVLEFNHNKLPVLYAGDFNGLTERSEYAVLTHRPLTQDHLADLHDIPSADESRSLPDLALRSSVNSSAHYDFNTLPDISPANLVDLFNHWPTFYSAYAQYAAADPNFTPRGDAFNEPRWTTKTSSFSGTLDYVFLVDPRQARSDDGDNEDEFPWRVTELLAMMPDDVVGSGLPNDMCPSDHVPLMVKLALP